MDLGECPQIHDLALRADYEAAQKKRDHFYDIDVSTNQIEVIIIFVIRPSMSFFQLNASFAIYIRWFAIMEKF